MKKKILLIPLVLLLAISLVAVGCAKPAPTPAPAPPPAPAPAPAPTPAPAPAPAPTTWRWATLQSPQNPVIVHLQEGFDAVTEQTEGRLKFRGYYGTESGFDAKEYIHMLEEGLMDAAFAATSTSAFEYPWLGVFGIPYIAPDINEREYLLAALRPMLDEFCKEHGIIPLAYPLHWDTYLVLYSTRNIQSLADSEGMLIRVYDPNSSAAAEGLGGTPVFLQKSEVYLGLQKGTIDGAMTGTTSAEALHFDEVCEHEMKLWTLFAPNIVGVSKIAWDKISPDDQLIVRNVMSEWEASYWDVINDPEVQATAFDYAISHGMNVFDAPPDVKEVFVKVRDFAIENFLEESGAKGEEALEKMKGALAELGY